MFLVNYFVKLLLADCCRQLSDTPVRSIDKPSKWVVGIKLQTMSSSIHSWMNARRLLSFEHGQLVSDTLMADHQLTNCCRFQVDTTICSQTSNWDYLNAGRRFFRRHFFVAKSWNLHEDGSHVATADQSSCVSTFDVFELFPIKFSLCLMHAKGNSERPSHIAFRDQSFFFVDYYETLFDGVHARHAVNISQHSPR